MRAHTIVRLSAVGFALIAVYGLVRVIPQTSPSSGRQAPSSESIRGVKLEHNSAGMRTPDTALPAQDSRYMRSSSALSSGDLAVQRGDATPISTAATDIRTADDPQPAEPIAALPAPSTRSQVQHLIEQMRTSGDTALAEHARRMMLSSDAVLRTVGAALLVEAQNMDNQVLTDLAQHTDVAVPLTALEWLRDAGRSQEANALAGALKPRLAAASSVTALLISGALTLGGGEALNLLQPELSAEDARSLYLALAGDDCQEYEVRMRSAMDLRDVASFDEYRHALAVMAAEITSEAPLLAAGIRRLAERCDGPAEISDVPATLSCEDVDRSLMREHPMDLEDLALQVEDIVRHADTTVATGVTARLMEGLNALADSPLTADDQAAIHRMEQVMDRMAEIERTRPALVTLDPPPGLTNMVQVSLDNGSGYGIYQ